MSATFNFAISLLSSGDKAGFVGTPVVSSLRDSICVKFYPALPCRATDCPVPSGLIASGDLRFFPTPLKPSSLACFYGPNKVVPRYKTKAQRRKPYQSFQIVDTPNVQKTILNAALTAISRQTNRTLVIL